MIHSWPLPFVMSGLLHRSDQVFWLWTRCSDPVWYQKWPLHRQRIPRGEQVARHAWWVHQKICAVYRVWQPWNWSGEYLTCTGPFQNTKSGTYVFWICTMWIIRWWVTAPYREGPERSPQNCYHKPNGRSLDGRKGWFCLRSSCVSDSKMYNSLKLANKCYPLSSQGPAKFFFF